MQQRHPDVPLLPEGTFHQSSIQALKIYSMSHHRHISQWALKFACSPRGIKEIIFYRNAHKGTHTFITTAQFSNSGNSNIFPRNNIMCSATFKSQNSCHCKTLLCMHSQQRAAALCRIVSLFLLLYHQLNLTSSLWLAGWLTRCFFFTLFTLILHVFASLLKVSLLKGFLPFSLCCFRCCHCTCKRKCNVSELLFGCAKETNYCSF